MEQKWCITPDMEDTSILSTFPINAPLQTEVRIAHKLFRREDDGYSVYDVEDSNYRWFKINGYFPAPLKLDAFYTLDGVVKKGKYGRVLQVLDYRSALPEEENAIITVLRTLPRLDTRAPQVYQALGPKTLELILESPEEVARQVKWVGLETAKIWQKALQGLKESDIILETLQNYQIPSNSAKQLLEKYPDILERLKNNPYFLLDEIRGFGFLKCDRIALTNGYPLNGMERLQCAMLYILQQTGFTRGDCYMTVSSFWEFVQKAVHLSLDFKTAQTALARKNENTVEIGGKEVFIDREKLAQAFQRYRKHPGTRTSFSYICEKVPNADLQKAFQFLCAEKKIVVEEDRVYLHKMYEAEVQIARCLKTMMSSTYGNFPDAEIVLNEVCQQEHVVLEDRQREAVLTFCASRGGVFVLNGHAGCGKTFTLRLIIKVLEKLYRRQNSVFSAEIMAPTGKAAQVAHASTGLPARTVHQALHIVAGQFESNTTLSKECVVIDEFSMMGLMLSSALLQSITPATKVIIMGDYDQLPSIDPGNVLKDIIESKAVPVVTLDVVKRQAEGSGILFNANEILAGHPIRSKIVDKNGTKNNAFLLKADDPVLCRDSIVSTVRKMRRRGYALPDIQVLCPQKKTDVGVDSLNYFLQKTLNPQKENGLEVLRKWIDIHDENGRSKKVKLVFREGDKVIHTANNYDMHFYNRMENGEFTEDFSQTGIVNGETGIIAKIMEVPAGKIKHTHIYVQYGKNRYARYEDNWDDLSLAYALTIHRSQGSQWPVVIAPVLLCSKNMLNRKLFYTLCTRAQETSVVFGSKESIQYAVSNDAVSNRNTWLQKRLQKSE